MVLQGLTGQGSRRAALLVLSMLSACAANDFGLEDSGPPSRFKPTGTIAAYLGGRFAAQRSDLDVAADKLGQAARESGVPEVANRAFVAALLAGRPEAARMAETLPNNPSAQLLLADQDALAGRWEDAQARFSGLPQQGLTQVLRPILVAWAQAGAGRTAAALATMQPYVDTGPLHGVMSLHAALMADLGGQTVDAARLYRQAQAGYGPMNLRLGQILASWQSRSGFLGEGQRIIAEVTSGSGDLAMARPAMERELMQRPVRNATDGLAEAYLAVGATLRQQNGADTAEVMLRLALGLRPDFSAARLLLADIQDGQHHPEMALQTLVPVSSNDALAAVVEMRRAGLESEAGHAEAADRLLAGMAQRYPDRPEPLALQADLLRRKSKFGEAIAVYDQAIARVGTPSRANWPLFYERGVAYERAGEWPKAESDFLYALRLAPEQPSILNYLGYAWTERNEHLEDARGMIQRAVQARPDDGSFVDSLGWILLRQGDAQGALKNLMHAVELVPEDALINSHLGDALAAVGRWREAEFQWRRALTLKLEAEDLRHINERLASLPAAR